MAERNFDEEFGYEDQEGHTFTLGGYTFHTPAVVAPGAFLTKGRGMVAAMNFLRRVVLPEERADLERIFETPELTPSLVDLAPDLLGAASLLLGALEIGSEEGIATARTELQNVVERAQAVEDRAGPIVSAHQVDIVAEWLMEATIGRPTISPSSSGNGDGRISTGSKATSRARAKAGKT